VIGASLHDRQCRLSLGAIRHAIEETTKVTVMLYWLFLRSSALIGVYTRPRTRLIQDP